MATNFEIYTLDVASQAFPPQHARLDEIFIKRREELGKLDTRSPRSFKIGLAIGIIIMLGSIFAILAAHQVLPTGLNAFNQLHGGSYVIGYGLLTAGFIMTLIDAVKWRNFGPEIASTRRRVSNFSECNEYSVKIAAIQEKLADNEVLAISAQLLGAVDIHILTKQDDHFCSSCDEDLHKEFYTKTPVSETRTFGELLKDKEFTTLYALQKRHES